MFASVETFFKPDWRSGKAVPTRITLANGEPMGLAGLWAQWVSPTDETVDAVNDAELLAMVLGHRADQITAKTQAALDTRDVIKRAQNN
jgi:hypothetical protein